MTLNWETSVISPSQNLLCYYWNVFAKIDIPRPLKFVYQHLLRPRLVVLTPSNPMQPLFPTWYNPDKRCEYHGRGLGPFIWIVAKFSRIETGWWWARSDLSLWMMMSSAILSPEHPQIDKRSKMLGQTQILPEKLIQEWCWIVNHFIVDFCHFAFCFGVTSHPWTNTCISFVFLLFWNQEMLLLKGILTKYFDQTPTCKIKANQS